MRARFRGEEDPKIWARAVHAGRRLWFLTVFGNALLFAVMIGVPYARGISRAEQMWHGYAAASACLLGGEAAENPGLGRVDDLAGRVAASMLARNAAWLKRCDLALSKLVPEAAIFVWPPAKEGEARAREAVTILRRELSSLGKLAKSQPLPNRPLRALEQLHQVLNEHALQTGALNIPPQRAVTFKAPAITPSPARLPLYVGADVVLTLWGNDSELFAVGIDRTGLSYLHADKSKLERARHVRPKLLQSFQRFGDAGFLAYAVSAQKCKERPLGCAEKSLGLAPATLPLTSLSPPRWLASHPAGRIDQSLSLVGSTWHLASVSQSKKPELRRIELSAELGGEAQTSLPPAPLSPSSTPAADQLVVIGDGLTATYFGATLEDGVATLWGLSSAQLHSKDGRPLDPYLARIPHASSAWVTACSEGAGYVLGSEDEVLLGRLDGALNRSWEPLPLRITEPLHERDPAKDDVKRLCVGDGALAFLRDSQQKLWLVRCEEAKSACRLESVADAVGDFAVLEADQTLLVAYAGMDAGSPIELRRFALNGQAQGKPSIPSACWSPQAGLCGTPYLWRLGRRVVLGAREGTDLLLLESADLGGHWQALAHDGQVHLH